MQRLHHISAAEVAIGTLIFFGYAGFCLAAISLPFHAHGEQNIDTHQVGYSDVNVQKDGSVNISTKFSNGKKIAGNNFFAVIYFVDASKKDIAAFVQWKGVDAAFGGKAREASITDTFKLKPDQLGRLDHITFRFGAKNCGFHLTGLILRDGDPNNGAYFSTVECGNQP